MSQKFESLNKFNPKFNQSLAPFTTWKIGGNAEVLIETKNSDELEQILKLAFENKIPFTILGNGSNVLISDNGLKNLVIINKSKQIRFVNENLAKAIEKNILEEKIEDLKDLKNPIIKPRHNETKDLDFYSFEDLDYQESGQKVLVEFDSGVFLPFGINWILQNNLSGLHWFAGIPGTIGGSLYNNIHGGTRHFSDYFVSSKIFDGKNGQIKTVGFEFFNFGYDQSILRQKDNKIIVLTVTLGLFKPENNQKAKFVAKEWFNRKRVQPKKSCGSVFQCLTPEQQAQTGFATPSIGYIVDKKLGLRGKTIGGVQIALKHGNFIVNIGNGKAIEVLYLIKEIKQIIKQQFNINILPEINFLGFEKKELEGILD
jgi:UDP-N-acetylmuramate dehydrogenase